MTREEAKRIAQGLITDFKRESETMVDFCNTVIKALEQQPCEDCISRQAVDELSKNLVHITRDKADFLCKFWEGLQKMPPVTPQPKIGQWMECGGDEPWLKRYCCSLCNFTTTQKYDYCTCGAKMIEPQESEKTIRSNY